MLTIEGVLDLYMSFRIRFHVLRIIPDAVPKVVLCTFSVQKYYVSALLLCRSALSLCRSFGSQYCINKNLPNPQVFPAIYEMLTTYYIKSYFSLTRAEVAKYFSRVRAQFLHWTLPLKLAIVPYLGIGLSYILAIVP